MQPNKNIFRGWSILNSILKLNDLGNFTIDAIRHELIKSLDGLDFTTSNMNIDSFELQDTIKDDLAYTYNRDTNVTDSVVRRSESLNQVSIMNNKISNKNINNESTNLHINPIK